MTEPTGSACCCRARVSGDSRALDLVRGHDKHGGSVLIPATRCSGIEARDPCRSASPGEQLLTTLTLSWTTRWSAVRPEYGADAAVLVV